MTGLPPGWYTHQDTPKSKRWWNGNAWEDKWQHPAGAFRIRFIETAPDGSTRTTDLAQAYSSQQEAEAVIQYAVNEAFGGRVPKGSYFEIYSINAQGNEESYGKWLGKRFARIGVAAAVGTAIGFLLGG